MSNVRPLVFLLAAVAACGGAQSPFVRVTVDDGRVYYARMEISLYSEAGGFLTFRDLVTKQDVRLKNGSYTALECPPEEVEVRQNEYINDPSKPPMASDYKPEPR